MRRNQFEVFLRAFIKIRKNEFIAERDDVRIVKLGKMSFSSGETSSMAERISFRTCFSSFTPRQASATPPRLVFVAVRCRFARCNYNAAATGVFVKSLCMG
jgi:hypothetical protein